ncbi:hypothetical protein Pogu_1677 [Pyrobaculum oguniense TE7]|uniref:Uncharacterized protein n=1 Tax=Pyrobaculum oguniense (strain DSM 13380 / JCM 10595 / TE7) TaxID=698757 RepID=H6QAU5_PYROT|nr:hypothetical protein Pogu_1677 [Pyrobaculum oguniense TE7]
MGAARVTVWRIEEVVLSGGGALGELSFGIKSPAFCFHQHHFSKCDEARATWREALLGGLAEGRVMGGVFLKPRLSWAGREGWGVCQSAICRGHARRLRRCVIYVGWAGASDVRTARKGVTQRRIISSAAPSAA